MKKISDTLIFMAHGLQMRYYAYFYSFVRFIQKPGLGTMGIGYRNGLYVFYDPDFVDKLEQSQLVYLLIHELYHPIYGHIQRAGDTYDRRLANSAQDCCINYFIDKESTITTDKTKYILKRPTIGDKDGCRLPDKFITEHSNEFGFDEKSLVWEYVYGWLLKNGYGPQTTIDDHSGLNADVSPDVVERHVKEISEKVKALGASVPETVQRVMELALTPTKKDRLAYLRKQIQALRGSNPTPSWRRFNRKNEDLRGAKRTGVPICVLWDFSGSMHGEHGKVASELYRDGYTLHIIGADTEVRSVFKVERKSQLKRIPFNGDGGTTLMPAVQYAAKHMANMPLVVLTDGQTDVLCFDCVKQKVLIITTDKECPTVGRKVKQVKI